MSRHPWGFFVKFDPRSGAGTAFCSAIMPSFLRMFTGDTQVIALACTYSTRVFAFAPVIGLGLAYEKIFQAVGRMKVSMICMMLGCVTNIILDPVMIFGLGTGTEA